MFVWQGWLLLSEGEVMERFATVEARKKRILEKKLRAEKRKEKKRIQEEMIRRKSEAQLQRKMEQQGKQMLLQTGVTEHQSTYPHGSIWYVSC